MKDNKFFRLYLINNKEEVNVKYFITFTFVGEAPRLTLFKEFITKLKIKKDFEYLCGCIVHY